MEKLLLALVIVQALALVVNVIAMAGQLALWSKVVYTSDPSDREPPERRIERDTQRPFYSPLDKGSPKEDRGNDGPKKSN